MSEQEKILLLEEIMDVEPGTIHINDVLSDYEEWDSLSVLAFISEMDERFGKEISGKEIKQFVTVADVLKVMN